MNMKLLKKIFLLALPLLAMAASITGCNEKENTGPQNTIDTLLGQTANLSIFKAALEKTGLNTFSKGGGPFTFFVPSNDAFKATGINTAADLDALDVNLLTQVLSYHIFAGRRTLVEIPSGPNAPAAMVSGLSIYASKNETGAYINGARISQADIRASNGVIHVIDRVLGPPFANLVTSLSANPNFKLLAQGIAKASLTTTLSSTSAPYTVMAPTNAAMTAAGFDSTTIANLTGTALTNFTNVLRYHLVPGRLFSSEFKNGTLKTLQGTGLPLTISGGPKLKGPANPNPINITSIDFLASTGVIHTIDGVLRY
jgi:uncharacterized surface protein with fasciclin (FAS1) repeats